MRGRLTAGYSDREQMRWMPSHTALTERTPYLWQAGCEQHTFKQLSHPLQELVHVWPLQHIDLESNTTSEVDQPPRTSIFAPRVKTCRLFAAHGHFLTQVIKNRPCRVNQPILDYLNQAEASHRSLVSPGAWFWFGPFRRGSKATESLLNTVTAEGRATP